MARGAWVGHMGGALGVVILFFLVSKILPKNEKVDDTKQASRKGCVLLGVFVCLGLLLPGYLYTSDFWKKGGVGWDRLKTEELNENYQILGNEATQTGKAVEKAKPVLVDTPESRELESTINLGSPRRLVFGRMH